MKFRKKPVIIDAVQWDGHNIEDILLLGEESKRQVQEDVFSDKLFIHTLEGVHEANLGDWIIKGVKGEIYPCKPDIFEMTYEPVTE